MILAVNPPDGMGMDGEKLPRKPAASVLLPPLCVNAVYVRRVKRFSVELEKDGGIIWAHTNNTGAMLGLPGAGAQALLSRPDKPGRKLPYTLERLYQERGEAPGFWIGVNTRVPNLLFEAAFRAGKLAFAAGYGAARMEAARGGSRMDACLENEYGNKLWVECKNVTLVRNETAFFPDAPSERARKHLNDLMEIVKAGERAAMFYIIQRPDARSLAPADFIDPLYAALFYQAIDLGVEFYAYEAIQAPLSVDLGPSIPIRKLRRGHAV